MKNTLLFVVLSALLAGSAPAATTTISGTIVNVAAYISGSSTASTLNMGAMMGANGMMGGNGTNGMMNANGTNGMMKTNGTNGMMNANGTSGMMGANGANGTMGACRSALGVVTSSGDLYLLIVEAPSANVAGLCRALGQHVTIQGEVLNKSGIRALRADSVNAG